jgi:hypothetical protein
MVSSWSWVLAGVLLVATTCGSSSAGPPGSCKTGGTATGSYVPACNECAKANCDAQLTDKAGSGWASQYFGGDGACAAFNGCICGCGAGGTDPFACATACAVKVDAACTAALQAAQQCLNDHCATACR